MSGFDSFLGNEQLIKRLKNDITNKNLSHAYIIEGGAGYGKRTLARLICQAISCGSKDPPCMECTVCDRISRSQAPDIITVEAEHDRVFLGVDIIRKLREDAYFAPIEFPKKIYVFPSADSMNPQAQNALLKILEEPPSHVMFLLLCENSDGLLDTIKSRAPTLRLEPLPGDTVMRYLKSAGAVTDDTDEESLGAVVKLSGGSIGKALSLISQGKSSRLLELYRKAEKYIRLLANRKTAGDELEFYEYASRLVTQKSRDDGAKIYSLTADAVRDLINVKLTSSPNLIFFTSEKEAEDLSNEFSIGSLMKLAAILSDTAASLETNVNLNLTLIKAASAVAKVTR